MVTESVAISQDGRLLYVEGEADNFQGLVTVYNTPTIVHAPTSMQQLYDELRKRTDPIITDGLAIDEVLGADGKVRLPCTWAALKAIQALGIGCGMFLRSTLTAWIKALSIRSMSDLRAFPRTPKS
jgi:hypothetical protein